MKTTMILLISTFLLTSTIHASLDISPAVNDGFQDLACPIASDGSIIRLLQDSQPISEPSLTQNPLVAQLFDPIVFETSPGIPDDFPTPPDDWTADNYLISDTLIVNGVSIDQIWYYERQPDGSITCTYVENGTNKGNYSYEPGSGDGGEDGNGDNVPEPATMLILCLGGLMLRNRKRCS